MEGTREEFSDLEFVGPNNINQHHHQNMANCKGKRTKRRQRPSSPCAVVAAMTSSSSSSVSGGAGHDYYAASTTDDSTEEEEDMANCLILLAHSGDNNNNHRPPAHHPRGSRRFADMSTLNIAAADGDVKVGLYVYECKTCNRSFPSFQALGGHRASHKKPKLMTSSTDEKKPPPPQPQPHPQPPQQYGKNINEHNEGETKGSPQISLQLGNNNNMNNNNKGNKVHECSICGSEFTSGQALGGHMRRHRPATVAVGVSPAAHEDGGGDNKAVATAVDVVKPRVLALDLNLPAPEEEDLKFDQLMTEVGRGKPLMLAASPSLVGCHY